MGSLRPGDRKRKDPTQMKERPAQVLGLIAGSSGWLAGLFLLDREPLFGVLGILGAMALLLGSLAMLYGSRAD